MKVCTKCKIEKLEAEFHRHRLKKDGLNSACATCVNQYYQQNFAKISKQQEQYQRENAKKIAEKKTQYYQKHTKKIAKLQKRYRKENAEKISKIMKQYYQENKEKIAERQRRYERERNETDSLYKFTRNVRSLVRESFKRNKTRNYKKQLKSEQLLGCTIPELRDHLERQFQPGMSFENHGEWHIDHIIPLSSAKTQGEIEKLCHYTNLQPLWAADNIKKSNKY